MIEQMGLKHSWTERQKAIDLGLGRGHTIRSIAADVGIDERVLGNAIRKRTRKGEVIAALDKWLEDRGFLDTAWDFIADSKDWFNRRMFLDLADRAFKAGQRDAVLACYDLNSQLEILLETFSQMNGSIHSAPLPSAAAEDSAEYHTEKPKKDFIKEGRLKAERYKQRKLSGEPEM